MRLALASMIGTALEWYDFMIYNTMAALIFNKLFFPTSVPMIGTLLAFSTYAVGYLSRPLGGVIFGRLGDRIGRRTVLMVTLIVMGLSTSLIAVLPTFAAIGIASPIVLVLLRLAQGIALGGEWAGAVLLTVEHGVAGRRGLNASWAQVGPGLGTILSSAVIGLLVTTLDNDQFVGWGWRVPFALSGLLVIFGLVLRRSIAETPMFQDLKRRDAIIRTPVSLLLRRHKRGLLVAASSRIGPDVLYALLVVFSITYVNQIDGLPRRVILTALLAGSACGVVMTMLYGHLSDRIGSRPIFAAGLLCGIPVAFAFFPLADTRQFALIVLAVAAGLAIHAAMYAVQGAIITEQFPPAIRYTGASIAYTFGSLAGGGAFAPLIMASLFRETSSTLAISLYTLAALLVSGAGMLLARETPAGDEADP
ncbi:MFS transporter [Gluconacetobacter azotocaptans]|nr:MFS transporter [Gluconacetobacter azotocaptans]